MRLDAYTIVFLRRGPKAATFSEEELAALQRGHLAFNTRMREAGHALVNGPFQGQPDETWRGMGVYRTSLEETRRLLADDPSVQAGRMTFDLFTWLVPEGALGDRPAAQIGDE